MRGEVWRPRPDPFHSCVQLTLSTAPVGAGPGLDLVALCCARGGSGCAWPVSRSGCHKQTVPFRIFMHNGILCSRKNLPSVPAPPERASEQRGPSGRRPLRALTPLMWAPLVQASTPGGPGILPLDEQLSLSLALIHVVGLTPSSQEPIPGSRSSPTQAALQTGRQEPSL